MTRRLQGGVLKFKNDEMTLTISIDASLAITSSALQSYVGILAIGVFL
jgi:hypothetical protein